MIVTKHWKDFDEDRKGSSRTLVIYGASFGGRSLLRAGITPDYFCDRNARNIGDIIADDGRSFSVLTPEELGRLKEDMDILVGIFNLANNIPEIVKSITDLFSEPCDIRVYYIDSFDEPFEIHGKVAGSEFLFIKNRMFDEGCCDTLRSAFFNCDHMTDDDFHLLYKEHENSRTVFNYYMIRYSDKQGKYISYVNGKRRTVNQPEDYCNKIYVFGDSRVNYLYNEDKFTVCSQLQALVNQGGLEYRVENHAIVGLKIPEVVYQIKSMAFNKNDVVFCPISVLLVEDHDSFEFILDAHNHCKQFGSTFVFVDVPRIYDRVNLSRWEEYFLQSFILLFADQDKEVYRFNRMKFQQRCIENGVPFFSIDPRFYDSKDTIFLDSAHWGDYGNKILANQLFIIVQVMNREPNNKLTDKREIERRTIEGIIQRANPGYRDYIKEILEKYPIGDERKKTGAIVMNCNPFTKGHRYLIERALEQVERLYIFVVEEDRSDFAFEDRFRLVKENTSDLLNVTVVPSGKFIISSVTFPGYFSKELDTQQAPDTSLDLMTFALCIAPALNITMRFVGEEPYCPITREYNEQMKKVLPKYGVEVIEIPRLGADGDIISASKVRMMLKEGEGQALEKYVPEATLTYLAKKDLIKRNKSEFREIYI